MLRSPTVAALLCLAAFTALAPNASAVYICGHQEDARDLVLGDDPVVNAHCTTENMVNYDCDAYVTVHQDGSVYRSVGCEPIIHCVTEPCPGPYTAPMATSSQPLPCLVVSDPPGDLSATCSVAVCEVGPVIEGGKYDHAVSCESFLQCVTEPCPGSGRIEI